jgi:hypothetical protein
LALLRDSNESLSLSFFLALEDVSQTALSAVLTVMMPSHEDTSTTGGGGALTAKTSNLARLVNLVVLENGQFDLLLLVLDLLGSSVSLLLTLLTTTEQLGVQVQGAVVLNTVQSEVLTISKGLASEREALESSRETFTLLNQGLNGIYRGVGINVQGKGVALERLYKDLHISLKTTGLFFGFWKRNLQKIIPKNRNYE